MLLVGVGVLAQAVVDVQRGDLSGAEQAHRQVEQADRVAPAGEHRDERRPLREQALGADRVEHRLAVHEPSLARTEGPPLRRRSRSRKSEVGSGNPLRLTAPIGS